MKIKGLILNHLDDLYFLDTQNPMINNTIDTTMFTTNSVNDPVVDGEWKRKKYKNEYAIKKIPDPRRNALIILPIFPIMDSQLYKCD